MRDFLLTKLINAEYASLKAPAFSTYSEKSIEHSLSDLNDCLENLTIAFTGIDFPKYQHHQSSSSNVSIATSPGHSQQSFPSSVGNPLKQPLTPQLSTATTTNSSSSSGFSVKTAFRRLSMMQIFSGKNSDISQIEDKSKHSDNKPIKPSVISLFYFCIKLIN